MKKLFVLPAMTFSLLLGTLNVSALEISSSPTLVIDFQEKYIELAIENLPQAVLDAVAKDFQGATISKASAKEDASEFKLELTKKNGEILEVFCDVDGKWIPKEE